MGYRVRGVSSDGFQLGMVCTSTMVVGVVYYWGRANPYCGTR